MNLNNINLKFLIKAHTKLGLFALFFFYISAFFGTFTLFLPQIQTWEKTSRYFVQENEYNYSLDTLINRTIQEEGFSTQTIEVTLPGYRDDVIAINDPASRTKYINPYTLQMLDTTSDNSFLSSFFNDIHVGRNIPKIGRFLMGIASILTIFLIISGIMLFINKHKTKQSFNFKWHRDISLVLAPYIIVFALTGSFLGFVLANSSPFAYAATDGKQSNMKAIVGPIIFPRDSVPKPSKEAVMLNIDDLKSKALKHYPNLEIKKIKLFRWYDNNAQIKFFGYLNDNKILTGKVNRQFITLSGVTGEIIEQSSLDTAHFGNKFLAGFYYFHFITDETLIVRVIYFILGIAFLLSLTFGFLIWSQKKASKFKNERLYYNFLSRFSIAVMFGVIPSVALILCLYWAVPAEVFQRVIWIKGAFYAFWAFTLVLSTLYEDIIDLLKSLALFTSIFLFGTLLAHIIKAKTQIALLVQSGQMHTALYVDLVLLIIAIISFVFYKKAHKIKWLIQYSRRAHVA